MNLLPSGENLTQLTKFEWFLKVNVPQRFSLMALKIDLKRNTNFEVTIIKPYGV